MYAMFEKVNTVPKIPTWAEMQTLPSHAQSRMGLLIVSEKIEIIKTQTSPPDLHLLLPLLPPGEGGGPI